MSAAQLRSVAAGVYAWIGDGGNSNAGAVETPHGLLAIDAQQSAALGEKFRDALIALGAGPIRAVINTHYHLDHVAGNVAFGDVPIVGHQKTLQALERELIFAGGAAVSDPIAKVKMFFGGNFEELVPERQRSWFIERVGGSAPIIVKPPTVTFADRMEFILPVDRLALEYWGPAHCDGDTVIRLEKAGIIFLGDLFFFGRFPWFGDCDLDGWIATLERVLTMEITAVVPGHGVPTTLKEVASFRDLLSAVRGAVAKAIKSGASENAAVAEIVLPAYAAMPRYAEWMPFNIRSAYRYLRGR